jgi:hypothetical protein
MAFRQFQSQIFIAIVYTFINNEVTAFCPIFIFTELVASFRRIFFGIFHTKSASGVTYKLRYIQLRLLQKMSGALKRI